MTFFGRTITVDEASDSIAIEGTVRIDWLNSNPANPEGTLQLSADRAVIFLKPGTLAALINRTGPLGAERVEGIYLEGDVLATDFNYTIRGRRIYYDIATNQALMVDAVLRTAIRRGPVRGSKGAGLNERVLHAPPCHRRRAGASDQA